MSKIFRLLAALALMLCALAAGSGGKAHATTLNCVSSPSACGYPDATTTGVPFGTTLTNVPAQATSGTGWSWNSSLDQLNITSANAVVTDLNVAGAIEIRASGVYVEDSKALGIQIPAAESNVTVYHCTVQGANQSTGRTNIGIDDATTNSTGLYIAYNDVSWARVGILADHGTVEENYIHDFGFKTGDHDDGIMTGDGNGQINILVNTVFNDIGQADAITLDPSANGGTVSNALVEYNFIAGGDYAIYGGDREFVSHATNMVIENNRFGQQYDTDSGSAGANTDFDTAGSGNVWTGNFFDTDGSTVAANS